MDGNHLLSPDPLLGVRQPTILVHTREITSALTTLFSELVTGARPAGAAFVLNSGDIGLLRSLDKLSAADASRSVNDGATIAAHAQHLAFGLSLMNRWAAEGGYPYADAKWDKAWKTSVVNDSQWTAIRTNLRDEAHQWLECLSAAREVTPLELSGMIATIAHVAYHLGAIRQIDKGIRGPTEGTFTQQ
jgi:hypothetical protein